MAIQMCQIAKQKRAKLLSKMRYGLDLYMIE